MESNYQDPTIQNRPNDMEDEIDLIELAKKLWDGRKLIVKCCGIAVLAALIVGFSIPKEYTASAVLSPEATSMKGMGGSLGQLAGLMGFNVGSATQDAVYPTLYPDVISSVPFLTDLFSLEVTDKKGKLQTTLYDYMENHNRKAWWSAVMGVPFKVLGWFVSLVKSDDEEVADADEMQIDTFQLTKKQMAVVKALGSRINVNVDKKTMIVELSVTMQDPLIAAVVTEAVIENLKSYVTDYRTSKSRNDLAFMEKLYAETKENYEKAQSRYADYVDRNQNIVLQRVRIEQERLQNEMNLKYNVYNQTAQQLQVARAKVQESTPVYAIVRPVTVPLRQSKPSKMMILVGFIFLAGVGASAWILFGRDIVEKLKSDN